MRRRGAILGSLLSGLLTVLGPGAVEASCADAQTALDRHDGELIALVGDVSDRDGSTAQVSVARWLAGPGKAAQVIVDDADRSGRGPLRVGVRYVMVAIPFDPPRESYRSSDCLPAVPQESWEGRRLLSLVEDYVALPATEPVALVTLVDPTFTLLGIGVAAGLIGVAMMRRRRLSD